MVPILRLGIWYHYHIITAFVSFVTFHTLCFLMILLFVAFFFFLMVSDLFLDVGMYGIHNDDSDGKELT